MFKISKKVIEEIVSKIKVNNLEPQLADGVDYFCILCSGGVADGCSSSCNNGCDGSCTGTSSCTFN